MRAAAIGIILNMNREQVLLVKRRDLPVWVLPGGGIDDGESPEQAVVREVFEETGLQVKVIRQAAEYLPINRWTGLTHIFLCQRLEGAISIGAESREVAYFPMTQLPDSLFCYHEEWLKEALDPLSETFIRKPMSQTTFRRVLKTYVTRPIVALRYLFARLGFPINS